jgi:hypothetical protein
MTSSDKLGLEVVENQYAYLDLCQYGNMIVLIGDTPL